MTVITINFDRMGYDIIYDLISCNGYLRFRGLLPSLFENNGIIKRL